MGVVEALAGNRACTMGNKKANTMTPNRAGMTLPISMLNQGLLANAG